MYIGCPCTNIVTVCDVVFANWRRTPSTLTPVVDVVVVIAVDVIVFVVVACHWL